VLDVHHIVADGAALRVLVRELLAVYRGDALAPLAVQAKDYTMWLQSEGRRRARDAAAAYWSQLLGGVAPLVLQTDFPRVAASRHRGARLGFSLGPARHAGLVALARAHGATLFMTTLSVFGAFLGRMAGREDLVIGTPVDGRRHPGLHGVIGLLIHMLPLRLRPVGTRSFVDLLAEVRAMVAPAFEHQALSVDDPSPDGREPIMHAEAGHPALFDVAFAFERADELAEQMVDMPGAAWQLIPYAHATGSAKFELTLTLTQHRDDLTAMLEYDTDLFLPETAANLRDKLCVAVDAILRAPDAPLAALELRTERELQLAQRVEIDFAF
jgi:iturin family lipopeptide synthetase B